MPRRRAARAHARAAAPRVRRYDVHRWVRDFLDSARRRGGRPRARRRRAATPRARSRELAAAHARRARSILLLDYDGTLVPFASTPDAGDARRGAAARCSRRWPRAAGHRGARGERARAREALRALARRRCPIGAPRRARALVALVGRRRVVRGAAPATSAGASGCSRILEEFARAHARARWSRRRRPSLAWHWRAADLGLRRAPGQGAAGCICPSC